MSSAVPVGNPSPEELQRSLSRLNEARLRPALVPALTLQDEMQLRRLELSFLENEREAIARRASRAPGEPAAFMSWYQALRESGPGQGDLLFPWLAQQASRNEMRWFLAQEVSGEAGFDDLVALTQLKLPVRAKLESARNYWDEMGRGNERGMHGPMLDRLASYAGIASVDPSAITWESVAVANLLVGLAWNRHFAYQSIGALGAIELTAPGRAELVNQGLARIGFPARRRHYFALHATLDVRHSEAWNREVIEPLVREEPRLARPIAEGALMRLQAGARCFQRYRRELGVPSRFERVEIPGVDGRETLLQSGGR